MDIYSKSPGPAGALSNFTPYDFVFDGVPCKSMEGLLQSLLTEDVEQQKTICQLTGIDAKRWGVERLSVLGETRWLWWKGWRISRYSEEYQNLLDSMYDALLRNEKFQAILFSSGEEVLTHSIASGEDESVTILTEYEFCRRLMERRSRLRM